MSIRAKYRGCLLGLATGDALGVTLEFKAPGTFKPITEMTGGGPFRLLAGEWTDDTSMALCLAESLIECVGFEPVDQLKRYVRWWRHGHFSSIGRCFDIGNTTRAALETFEATGARYCGSEDPHTAGNGSLMRLAPVPMFYRRNIEEAVLHCADSSRTTHAAPACIDACRYFGALIVGALSGIEKEVLLAPDYWRYGALQPEIAEIAAGSFIRRDPPTIQGSGYVVKSLEAALWAFHRSNSFREGCLLAANLGDDADTTTAVYGQLAGAYYEESAIPAEWRAKLALSEVIESLADRLCDLAERRQP